MDLKRLAYPLRFVAVLVAISCGSGLAQFRATATSHSMAIIQTVQDLPPTSRAREFNIKLFGRTLQLKLDVGTLGLIVILTLAVLFFVAILLGLIGRRRTKQAVTANRKLQEEIAERKRAEASLRENQERTLSIIQTALDGIVTMDHDGKIINFNPAAERIFGHRSGEVIGRELADVIIPPDLREQHRQGLKYYLETGKGPIIGKRIEISGLRADGSLVLLELSVSRVPGGEHPMFTGFLRDITERRQMEEARTQLALIVQSSDDAIISKTLEGVITSWNRGAEVLFGYSANEAVGKPMAMLIPADRASEEPDILALIARGEEVDHFETVRIGKGSQRIDVSVSISPIKDRHGKILGASNIARDITSRKRAEDERERFFALTADLLVIAGFNGRFTWVSPACERALGWSSEELTSHPWLHFVHAEDHEKTIAEAEKLFRGEETISFENRYRHKDGSYRWISWKAQPYMHEQSLYCAGTDISERKLLEEQLRQAQKLESIGLLAGGVAHDFNNLLTVITGYSDLTMRRLRQEDPLLRNLEEIRKAAERATSLTRQLLAFSRKQVLEPKILDLTGTVSNMDKMLQRLIGEDIKLVTILEPKLGKVRADPGQIEQVLMNLAINARDAMPGGGMLTIETKAVFLDEAYARRHVSVTPGPHVMVAVSDTGHGMDAETMARVFEPFFTTKEIGKGTGLGLAMVYGIVKQSGGNIWVYSEPQQGTTFKIYLPTVQEEAEAQYEAVILPERESATETLLLVEDEEAVRALLLDLLQSVGYTVLPASNGYEALEVCEKHDGPIHLLMTDVVMPGMSGGELVERLAGKCKDVKVLYMSGYTDNAIVHHGVLEPGVAFIQKPFTLEGVTRKIRDVLDSEQA